MRSTGSRKEFRRPTDRVAAEPKSSTRTAGPNSPSVTAEIYALQRKAGNRALVQLFADASGPDLVLQRMPVNSCTTTVDAGLEGTKLKGPQLQREKQRLIKEYYDEAKGDLARMRTLTKASETARLAEVEKMAKEAPKAQTAFTTKKWDDLMASLDKMHAIYEKWSTGAKEEAVVEIELDPDGNNRGMWGAGGAWVFTASGAASLAGEHGYTRTDGLTDHTGNKGGHNVGHNPVYVKGAVGISPDDRGDAGNWTWKEFKISGSEARYIGTLRYTGAGNWVFLKRGGGAKSGASFSSFPSAT